MDRDQDQLESMLKSLPRSKPSAELDARIARTLAQRQRGVRPDVIGRIWASVLLVAAMVILALAVTIGVLLRPSANNNTGSIASNNTNTSSVEIPIGRVATTNNSGQANTSSDAGGVPQTATLASAESSYTYAGVVEGADGQPVRVLQRHTVQKWTWIDPDTNARVEAQVPQEDVVLVSLAMY